MYARVIKLVFGPDSQWEAERIADLFYAVLTKLPGFRGVTFLADYANGEYASVTLWETEAHLFASLDVIRPQLDEVIGSKFQWEPSFQVFQVYEPRQLPLE